MKTDSNCISAGSFWKRHKHPALIGLVYSAVLYSLMMTGQLTNTFDGLWLQNQSYSGATQLSSGRWLLIFIDKLVLGCHADPIASLAALALFVAGFLFVLDLFNITSRFWSSLSLILFLASPFVAITLSYRFTSLGYAAAYLLAVLSIYALFSLKNAIAAAGISGVLLGLSMACYQAYLSVFCVLAVFYILFLCRREPQDKTIARRLLRLIGALCTAALFYLASLSLFLKLYNTSLSSYNNINQISAASLLAALPRSALKTYSYFFAYFFQNKLKLSTLHPLGSTIILVVLLLASLVFFAMKTKRTRLPLLLLAIAVLPMACNAYMLLDGGSKLELQMTAGLAILLPLAVMTASTCFEILRPARIVSAALSLALLYGCSMQVWIDQQAMYEGQNACDTMLAQVINDLDRENLLSADYEYFFVGVPEENPFFFTSDTYSRANAYAQMGRFWVSGGCCQASYRGLINRRMGLALPVSQRSYESIAAAVDTAAMPSFPDDGYITLLDDNTVVVKISQYRAYTGDSKYVIG